MKPEGRRCCWTMAIGFFSTSILHPFQRAAALRSLIWRELSMEKLVPLTHR